MRITIIDNRKELNAFVIFSNGGQFLQSFEWGEFQQSLGNKVWRLAAEQEGEIVAAATVISRPLPLSRSYLYCPYGPIFHPDLSAEQKEKAIKLFLSEGRDITISTRDRLEVFFRLEPRLSAEELGNFFFNLGLKQATAVQPRDTVIVDLQPSLDEILRQMHHKTRYNIRLAERKGVTVRQGSSAEDLEIFWQLLQLTTRRNNFHSHPKFYYEKMWNFFTHSEIDNQSTLTIELFIAEYQGQPLAAGLFSFFGDRVMYLHGASSDQHRNLMAPYLLHWHLIKLGKQYGYRFYDLNGIVSDKRKLNKGEKESHWQGITRFKKGFGGKEVNYVGAWDWVYDQTWYFLYNNWKKVRSFFIYR